MSSSCAIAVGGRCVAKKKGAPSKSSPISCPPLGGRELGDVARRSRALVANDHRALQVFPVPDACQRDPAKVRENEQQGAMSQNRVGSLNGERPPKGVGR